MLCPEGQKVPQFIKEMSTKYKSVCISDRSICSEGCGYFSQGLFYGLENGITGNLSQTERLKVIRVESCPSLMLGISERLNFYGQVEIMRDPGIRQCCFLGIKNQDYVRSIAFIAEEIVLIKMASYREVQ